MAFGTSDEIERSKILFNKISTFDFGKVVQKFTIEHKVSPDAASEILLELKRWFTLCLLHPEKAYATGGRVDEMWHTFILFTKDYARFCQDTAGAFIHHRPDIGSDDPEEQKISADRMAEKAKLLEADYLKYFGSPPPGHIWPGQQPPQKYENAFRFLEAMAR
jgi:hypothetical protein